MSAKTDLKTGHVARFYYHPIDEGNAQKAPLTITMHLSSAHIKNYFLTLLFLPCFSTSFAAEKLVTSPATLKKYSISANHIQYKINSTAYHALESFEHIQLINRRSNDGHLIFIGSKRSNPKKPMGFCGAGLEYSLILLSKSKHPSTHEDTLLLASCLTNNAPIDIREHSIDQILFLDPENNNLHIKQADQETTTIYIEHNKFKLATQQAKK